MDNHEREAAGFTLRALKGRATTEVEALALGRRLKAQLMDLGCREFLAPAMPTALGRRCYLWGSVRVCVGGGFDDSAWAHTWAKDPPKTLG